MIIIFENKEEETNYRFCDLWRKSTFVAVKNGEKYDIDRSRYGERLKSIDEKTLVQEIEKTITWKNTTKNTNMETKKYLTCSEVGFKNSLKINDLTLHFMKANNEEQVVSESNKKGVLEQFVYTKEDNNLYFINENGKKFKIHFEKLSPDFPKKVLFTKKRKPFEMANSKIIEGNLEVELNDYGTIFYRIDGEWYHFREIEILTRF